MKKLLNDVALFQAAYDAPCHPSRAVARASGDITHERAKFRMNLVFEETLELADAHGIDTTAIKKAIFDAMEATPPHLKDVTEISDAIGDSIYVEVGMALEYGIPLDHVWQEIQDSNMKKFPDGKAVRRPGDGKVMKPPGWKPPDIEAALQKITDAGWYQDNKPLRQRVEERADAQQAGLVKAGLSRQDGLIPSTEYNVLRMDALLDILSEQEEANK